MSLPAPEVRAAAEILRGGGLVAFPTETVYGLGADASQPDAVRRLFATKGRPADHPVIVHVEDASDLTRVARAVPAVAHRLARACWPGPLTLVLERRPRAVAAEVTGGRPTVAVRVPDHPVALDLLRTFGGAIAAPSANRFGRVSPTSAGAVRAELGTAVDLVLDGGECRVGIESTIVDCTGAEPVVRRAGGITAERLAEVVGSPVPTTARAGGASGTLPVHYAPTTPIELVTLARLAPRAAALVAAGRQVGIVGTATALEPVPTGVTVLLAAPDVDAYARGLYRALRAADDAALDVVLAVPPPDEGIGAAVADRLRRAAAANR